MALTDAERTDARRFCGYPAFGASPSGNAGWRFYQSYGALEYRLANLSDAELAVVRRFLAALAALEQAVPSAGDAMDTDHAAVWTRNRTEAQDRMRLLENWSRRLCAFIGVPPGPGIAGQNSVALVV